MNTIIYPARIENNNLGDILINGLLIRELLIKNIVVLKGSPSSELLRFVQAENPHCENLILLHENMTNEIFAKLKTLIFLIKNQKSVHCVFDTPGHLTSSSLSFKNILKVNYELLKVLIYYTLSIKYIKIGVTMGPYSRIIWTYHKLINLFSHKYAIRDKENLIELENRGFRNLQYIPDLAYLLYESSFIKSISTNQTPEVPFIIISIRDNIIGHATDYKYYSILSNFLCNQINKVTDISDIRHIKLTFQVEYDKAAINELAKKIQLECSNVNIEVINEKLNFSQAIFLYKESQMVITNRLHVFLLALLSGGRSIITTDTIYHKKVTRILVDNGMKELLFDINNTLEITDAFKFSKTEYKTSSNFSELKNDITHIINDIIS